MIDTDLVFHPGVLATSIIVEFTPGEDLDNTVVKIHYGKPFTVDTVAWLLEQTLSTIHPLLGEPVDA